MLKEPLLDTQDWASSGSVGVFSSQTKEPEKGGCMETKAKLKILIDLEKQNRLNAEGCLACGHKFNLGDEVVLARGKWQGFKFIHEGEAIFDQSSDVYYERKYYQTMKSN